MSCELAFLCILQSAPEKQVDMHMWFKCAYVVQGTLHLSFTIKLLRDKIVLLECIISIVISIYFHYQQMHCNFYHTVQ